MIGLALTFELGRYHATPWGEHVNDGAVEWPPSPLRLLRALYAVSRTHAALRDRRDDVDRGLAGLVAAGPPRYVLPPSCEGHTRHYLPLAGSGGKTALVLDGFRAVARDARLEAWWDVELDEPARHALAATTQRIGYVGRSESVCRAKLVFGAPPGPFNAEPAQAGESSSGQRLVHLLCPDPGAGSEVLTADVTSLRANRRRLPAQTHEAPYLVAERVKEPVDDDRQHSAAPTLAVFRLRGGSRPGMREAVVVGDLLRHAAQSRFGRLRDGGSSSVLSGRRGDAPRDDQHHHAHYLALNDPGSARVDRLVVWAPAGLPRDEVSALARVDHVRGFGLDEPLDCALSALGSTDELDLPRILGPSRCWRSLTPFALVRHPKRRADGVKDGPEDQVRRELELRGLPAAEVRLLRGRWHEFRRARPSRSNLSAPQAFGVELEFAEAVRGPIALGALCHFGLGLFESM